MGIDELKVIIQALAGLADGAKEGFIWWMVIEGALPKLLLALFGAGVLGTGIYVAKLLVRHAASANNAESAIRQISKIVGTDIYGSCWMSASEVARVVDAVSKLAQGKAVAK
ncbi:hypothetical protein [Burkholderia sp. NRF60-BP8]|uniref:hypothetical protein n=1 Tax=Burkholderia sp. NRF60-BP8 TaxID=1637853 RepID=UPI00076C5C59|nr:hypothetical protein [Burkholderia sp. NRF60-BP8]KVA07121.1 hypothetical protein WS54_23440 [Burkholderia sp. NRF60-BP8]